MTKKLLWLASAILLTTLSLLGPSTPAAACPSDFCTSAQRNACAQTCHNKGIGLLCDFSTCTSECICGSVPPGQDISHDVEPPPGAPCFTKPLQGRRRSP